MVSAQASSQPRWSVVLRALREAAGLSQAGWAALLGFGRSTVQRWERGELPPGPDAEAALVHACTTRGLLRTFYQGPLRGLTVNAELIRDLLAEARLSTAREPAPRPPNVATTPLPRLFSALHRTSFVGRERELAEVERLLNRSRLVTLNGPGGAGKTRLALQLASRAVRDFPDGVWLVDLSALAEPEHVPRALLPALGIRDEGFGEVPPLTAATVALAAAHALLVLDNCEHLLAASAEVVNVLLDSCPRLHVLTTSRQPLGLAGEHCWSLAGLALPPDDASIAEAEAVQLFVDRAAAVRPGFVVDADNAAAIARICRRLDGLPLAIELAAARIRVLAPAQVADRLEDHVRLLASTDVTAAPRQQTLRATLDWSYELLTPPERVLLAYVGVFAGGWTLAAAEAVSSAEVESDVLDVLTSLVAKSLVVADLRSDHARYRLLETVRQYALDKLESAELADAARSAHLRWCLALAEAAEPHLRTAEQATWLDQLEEELENIRAALGWSLAAPTPERLDAALRMAAALRWFWFTRGRSAEGRAWLERALGLPLADGVAPEVRGRALDTAAALAHSQGAYAQSRTFQDAALVIWRALRDDRHTAAALSMLGIIAKAQGEVDRAAALLNQSLDMARQVDDVSIEATVLNNLAALAIDVGDYARARSVLEQSLAIKRRLGDAAGIATSLYNLGETAVQLGEYESAVTQLAESLALFRRLGASNRIAQTLHSLGMVALRRGDLQAAREQLSEAQLLFERAGDGWGQALCLEGLAEVALAAGDATLAARLFGAADTWRQANGAPIPPNERAAYDQTLGTIAGVLGETAFAVAWADGRAMALELGRPGAG